MDIRRKSAAITWMLLFVLCSTGWAENLLQNPGFEEGTNLSAKSWRHSQYLETPVTVIRGNDNPHSGDWYISLATDTENDLRLIQDVAVSPNKVYRLSGWLKAENVGTEKLGVNLSLLGYFYNAGDLKGTTEDWRQVELYFKTARDTTYITVCLNLGGYANMNYGKASFDDLELVKVDKAPGGTGVFTIPVQKENQNTAGSTKGGFFNTGKPLSLFMATLLILGVCLILLLIVVLLLKRSKKSLRVKDKLLNLLPPLKPEVINLKSILLSPYLHFLFFCILAIPFIVDLANAMDSDFRWGMDNHYLYQAEAFLQGKIEVSRYVHDMAVFHGKNYVIYPPFPVLLVLPFVAIWGLQVKVSLLSLVIAVVSVIYFYRLLKKLNLQKKRIPWVMAAFFLGSAFWFCYTRASGVAFFAHLCAAAATILCLNEALGKGRGWLVGIFLGMAFLSRQLCLFLAIFLIFLLWEKRKTEPLKKIILNLGMFCLSLGVCLVVYFVYNYARFGNIFDTGYAYLQLGGFMQERVSRYGLFSPAYIPFNFTYLFLQGFHFEFTGLKLSNLDMFGTAITFASPFVFFAFRAKWKKWLLIAAWASIAVILLGHLTYYNNGWVQFNTQRFSLDFMPLLMILVALGINDLPEKFWKPVILFSIIMNALCMWLVLPPQAKLPF